MDVKRIGELSTMITNLKKAAEELTEIWYIHAEGCTHIEIGDDDDLDAYDYGCTHSDSKGIPSCNSACTYANCPLTH